ncbi:hypothetical protein HHK36_004314 [Tetracentron sinense]|uniref:Aspartic proteinase Asp1 n=1 Tax=Tetracentron sinense TaxID=13715 RepID=A0A834ZZR7_TETSI|nr:hypothetical protein HHK36_004314 [Tetracentron sinense]
MADSEMDKKRKVVLLVMFFWVLAATFRGCSSASNQQHSRRKHTLSVAASSAANRFGSSALFPIQGNVYPDGYYYVSLNVGEPPKPYYLDIDTGSDLTWLQCDAPCVRCTKAPHPLYRPNNNLVLCKDPFCASLNLPNGPKCETPEEQCDYEIEYADHGSSLGVLVKDIFQLRFTNGSLLRPHLSFGCGYDQQVSDATSYPLMDGVLGLGGGKSSIVSQLHGQGLTRNVIGHCFSGRGGGFLFFGDDVVPSSGVVWTPMLHSSLNKHYSPGPTELIYGGQHTGVKRLFVVFDSGSSYSYFNSQAYQAFISLVRKDLNGKPLREALDDRTLPVCWKGPKPFKSVRDVQKYFKLVVLSFPNSRKAQLEFPPEAYLIITSRGNVCLGILNGTEVGLKNLNIIGDISLQDKMVIYDNEKQQIGWIPADCDRLPNVDRDNMEGFFLPYAASLGILTESYHSTYGSREDKYHE